MKVTPRGIGVAQLDKRPALDFSSGHDLIVVRSSPLFGSVLTVGSLLGILSLLHSLPLPHSPSLSNKFKKYLKIKIKPRMLSTPFSLP